eukprot:scaffold10812_cov28-Tisochrysis_lutea.AAC.2
MSERGVEPPKDRRRFEPLRYVDVVPVSLGAEGVLRSSSAWGAESSGAWSKSHSMVHARSIQRVFAHDVRGVEGKRRRISSTWRRMATVACGVIGVSGVLSTRYLRGPQMGSTFVAHSPHDSKHISVCPVVVVPSAKLVSARSTLDGPQYSTPVPLPELKSGPSHPLGAWRKNAWYVSIACNMPLNLGDSWVQGARWLRGAAQRWARARLMQEDVVDIFLGLGHDIHLTKFGGERSKATAVVAHASRPLIIPAWGTDDLRLTVFEPAAHTSLSTGRHQRFHAALHDLSA